MKTFTIFTSLLFLSIAPSYAKTDLKQQAALKKLKSYGCKYIQDAQGKSAYVCKSDAPKSLIKYYTQIIKN